MLKPSLFFSACLFGCAVVLLAMPHPVKKFREPRTSEPVEVSRQPTQAATRSEQESREEGPAGPPRVTVNSNGLIPTHKSIEMFETRVLQNPQDTRSRVVLAALYMRLSKETHNHQALHKAETQLRHVLKISPNSLSALTQLGNALLAQHKFAEALEAANRVLRFDAKHPSGLAVHGDAHLELGNYTKAEQSYEKLAAIEKNAAVTIRLAHLAELTGKLEDAGKLMKRAHQEILDADPMDRTLAWYELRLATFELRRGNLETAATHFDESLKLLPDYLPALEGLAQVEAANENFERAESLLRRAVKQAPRPATMAKLSGVLNLLGKTKEADDWLAEAHEQLFEESKDDPQLHYREFSQFLSDHNRDPKQALEMAQQDLSMRKDIFAYHTLAWAQFRNGQFESAAKTISIALEQGTADAELHFHAALILNACGRMDDAGKQLERAFEINPHFSFGLSNETRQALNELEEVVRAAAQK